MTKSELLKAIRLHCLDCCCEQPKEVELCGCPTCHLFSLRFGKDPSPRVLSPEEKERRKNLLVAARAKFQESKDKGDAE